MQVREKVEKSQNTVLQCFVSPEGRKVRSLNCTPLWHEAHVTSGALLEVQIQMSKKCTPLWCEACFQVNMRKKHHVRSTFGSWNVQNLHVVAARSTFRSQNVKKKIGALLEVAMLKKCTSLWREAHFEVKMRKAPQASGHFSKFRCRKSARRFGTKHTRRSKVLKTGGLGALFEVKMSKKCTLLRREAHAEIKIWKAHHVRTTFGRSTAPSRHPASVNWDLRRDWDILGLVRPDYIRLLGLAMKRKYIYIYIYVYIFIPHLPGEGC